MGSILSNSRFSVLTCALAVAAMGVLEGCSSSSAKSDAAAGTGGTGGSTTGTGGAGGSTTGTGGAGGGGAALTLTSAAFAEGETIPAENTCAGINTSPPLSWTAGPAATMSYAVILTDLANMTIHWLIWDIPAAPPHALPGALPNTAMLTNPAGAKQAHHIPFFMNNDNGYRGPCPSGAQHTYQFEVHALDVATLPTVTTTSTPPEVKTQITAHSLAHGDLSGLSTASPAGQ